MACAVARGGECLSSVQHKFPIVTRGVKGEFHNSERVRLSHFAVGLGACARASVCDLHAEFCDLCQET